MSSYWDDSSRPEEQPEPNFDPYELLNFIAAVATTDLPISHKPRISFDSGIPYEPPRVAGLGAYASVQIGKDTKTNRVVAVKRPAKRPDASTPFERHFAQLSLELRILGHGSLRQHLHIVDILGLYLDGSSQLVSLSIVLEYSSLGNLSSFLNDREATGNELAVAEKVALASDVASGLVALHRLRICHGDVKTQNCLVFAHEDGLVAKVSDFGNSLVPKTVTLADPQVLRPVGTRLLTAPELDHLSYSSYVSIYGAIQTDIYSFGLLLWEVLKNGKSYFEALWIPNGQNNALGAEEEYFGSLAGNDLSRRSIQFLATLDIEQGLREVVHNTFNQCLQVLPSNRGSMLDIALALRCSIPSLRNPHEADLVQKDLQKDAHLSEWTFEYSLAELLHRREIFNGFKIDRYPFDLQQQFFEALKALASSNDYPSRSRAQAAMMVSECYAFAYGCSYSSKEVLRWLELAATGEGKAHPWYSRVKQTIGPASTTHFPDYTEDHESYVVNRIQHHNSTLLSPIRELWEQGKSLDSSVSFSQEVRLFDDSEYDIASDLHIASLLGDVSWLSRNVHRRKISETSLAGLTPLHYACAGGQLAAIRLLLKQGADPSACAAYGITAMHLAIFCPESMVENTINILRQYGATTDASATVRFGYHDIVLEGNALIWAVLTRNRAMVRAVLPHTHAHVHDAIRASLLLYFPEIAEDLISTTDSLESFRQPRVYTVQRPFCHWISHGQHGRSDIRRTIQLADKLGWIDHDHALRRAISSARSQPTFDVIAELIKICPRPIFHHTIDRTKSILSFAVSRSLKSTAWLPSLELILENFTAEEVNAYAIDKGQFNYLHSAVSLGATVAVQALLISGADANLRTRDDGLTPLHLCIWNDTPLEIWKLLIEAGADLRAVEPQTGMTALGLAILERRINPMTKKFLDSIVEHADATLFSDTLHHMLKNVIFVDTPGLLDPFIWALSQTHFRQVVNSKDKQGLTMLHKAIFRLHFKAVACLLEAGADPAVPLRLISMDLYPLQMICIRGRYLHIWGFTSRDANRKKPIDEAAEALDIEQRALDSALEILEYHIARGDDIFRGITRLHLLRVMSLSSEKQHVGLYAQDAATMGSWPGRDHQMTPMDLGQSSFETEWTAMIEFVKAIRW